MQSTLNPKQTDDPHDLLVVASDAVLVAPTDEELSKLAKMARDTVRSPSDPQTHTGSGFSAGPPVPPVDTTFRPSVVNNTQVPGHRPSIGRRAVRGLIGVLLAACIGVAAIAWQAYADAAKQMIAKWAPQQLALTSSLSPEKPGLPAQPAPPAVEAAAANAAPPQPAPLAQTAPQGVAPAAAPSADSAQLLQSMAHDLASVSQEVEQLKASIEQLKAGQQQMSRDVAKASEQNSRPRISALPPRPAVARARRPMPPYPSPQAAAAPTLPQTAAPYYVPRQPEPQPQVAAEPQAEPDSSSVPRPPMPVR
jgi:hypothetical protein